MSTQYEPGGVVPDEMIPLSVPEIVGNEWKYVKDCLDSGWVSSAGEYVDRFESALASYVNTKMAVAAVNGTAALHIALLVSGVKPDDEVIVSSLTFIAPVNAIRYVGAWPVFIDAEPDYWQLDSSKVIKFVETQCRWSGDRLINKNSGRRVRAMLPVHILGHPVDIDPLIDVANKYDLRLIEDATESLGAKYKNKPVGMLGDMACFSFNGNKIITTGGGGMIVSDNMEWMNKAKYLTTQAKDDPVEYIHNEIGYNYRLSNTQAAIGCAQMENLDEFVIKKRNIANRYNNNLSDIRGITLPGEAEWAFSTYWMYTILIDPEIFGASSRTLMKWLYGKSIQSRPLWHPIYNLEPYKNNLAYRISNSDRIYAQSLSLPCSVGLSSQDQDSVIGAIREFSLG